VGEFHHAQAGQGQSVFRKDVVGVAHFLSLWVTGSSPMLRHVYRLN
jgi:hypothetical protein